MDLQPQSVHPHQELVKCVVVGDTAVGKTRLICARALDSRLQLNQLISTHIPTVWAIDQYRIHKQVLERSCEVVDGVNVSLRLWDTFGDHDKDRKFAYGRSDVVLLCFSIANPNSLRNCKTVWYPEIRKFCPNTPIILVGCKNDLRYMYNDDQYLNLCKEKSPFYRHACKRFTFEYSRQLKESDILAPETCRKVAEDLEIPYYESSVFTPFGIDTVFQNVIRVALLHRRQQRFWFNHLKSVQQPTLQDPYCPKKPLSPEIQVGRSTCVEQMTLFHEQMPLADVRLLTAESGEPISSHRMMLSIASDVFARLFQRVASVSPTELEQHFRCDQSTLHFNSNSNDMSHSKFKMFAVDQSNCQSCFRSKISSLEEIFSEAGDSSLEERSRLQSISDEVEFDHPAFSSLKILTRVKENVAKCCDSWCDQSRFVYQVQLSDQICREALQRCILFAYTGSLGDHQIPLDQLMLTAELLQFNDVIKLIQQALTDQNHSSSVCASIAYRNLMHDWSLQQLNKTLNHLHRTALNSEFTDVIFQLDDGRVSCHKPILVARCEMMGAMFTSNFRESSLRVIQLPGIDCVTFNQFIRFVYTDDLSTSDDDDDLDSPLEELAIENWCRLLELADRFCLTRLLQLVEQRVVSQMKDMSDLDSIHQALKILQRCQMHNAEQLADHCLHWISVNYCDAASKLGRLLRSLHPENQAYLNTHRWPPVWYIKERDYYERCVRERIWCDRKLGLNQYGGTQTNESGLKHSSLRLRKRSLCCLFFKRGKVTYTPL